MTPRKPALPSRKPAFSLVTAADRKALLPRKSPYWLKLAPGIALGYERIPEQEGGVWVARLEKPRKQERLGTPDEGPRHKALPVLSFEAAVTATKRWCLQAAQAAQPTPVAEPASAPPREEPVDPANRTVGDALDAYLTVLESRQVESFGSSRNRIQKTKREIGHLLLVDLVPKHLEDWRGKILVTPPQIRGKKGEPPRYRANWDPQDPENKRARQSSANRALADLLAALNAACTNGWMTTEKKWNTVKPFQDCVGVREEVLSLAEQSTLLNRASPEFRPLLYGALMTAQRFGPLSRLKVKDFRPKGRVVKVGYDKKRKKDRLAPLVDESMAVFWAICRGRNPEEYIFLRANGKPWAKGTYDRTLDDACGEDVDITFYGLRHSCITMWLLHGVDKELIAEAANTSTQMIDAHYKNPRAGWVADEMNKKTHAINVPTPEMEAILAEIAQMQDPLLAPAKALEFTYASLHPSQYVGRIKGGREEAPPPKPRPTPEELASLIEEMPLGMIGKRYGVSGTTVAKWCRREGLVPSGRGVWAKRQCAAFQHQKAEGAPLETNSRPAPPTREELARLLKEMPATAIGERYGVCGPTVLKWARKLGLRGRKRGEWPKHMALAARIKKIPSKG